MPPSCVLMLFANEILDRVVAVVPLQRDLGVDAVAVAVHEDRLLVDDALVLVQVLDERDDAAVVVEAMALAGFALIVERDRDAGVQERELAQAAGERVEAELDELEDLRIGLERDLGAAALGGAGDGQVGQRLAALVALLVRVVVAPDFQIEPLRQRVDDRHADAVQAARHLVGAVVELAAGVQDRQRDFGGRLAALVHVGRNAAAVVDDADRVVEVNRDVDFGAETGERFVDRVVDDLVDQVMQSGRPRGADVHRRTLADRFKAFEDLDAFRAVFAVAAVGRYRSVLVLTSCFLCLDRSRCCVTLASA